MKLNSQQKKVNETTNKNVVVSASAGTGKTTVLTARIIGYLMQPDCSNDIMQYLIVSYTEAAARELKERISRELKKAINDSTTDGKLKSHLQEQLARIPMANISTIHSFCLEVIRKYGYVLGIDPAAAGKLADDGKLRQLQDKAIKQALYGSDHNELIYRLADRPEDISKLQENIIAIDQFIQNIDYASWKKRILSLYSAMEQGDYSLYPIDLKKHLQKQTDDLKESYHEFADIYRTVLKKGATLDKLERNTESFEALVVNLNSLIEEGRFEEMALTALNWKPETVSARLDENDKERRDELKKQYEGILDELGSYYRFKEANRENAAVVRELLEITEEYRRSFSRLKEENGVIGFEDMLRMAREILLANNSRVADIYRDRFKEIMVDEYQDTNEFQESIISSIARDDNVFRVGDIKQSIYKFQNAKPQLMKSMVENPDEKTAVLNLQLNYRSYKTIIDFSNYIFEKLLNIGEGSYVPENDDLILPQDNAGKIGKKIQLVTVPYESDDKIAEGDKIKPARIFDSRKKVEFVAEYIASEMCRLKESDNSLNWSSFAVLTRTNKHKRALKTVMDRHHIPVFTTAKSGFFSDASVSGVVSLLNLVASDSRLNAVNVLTGPLFSTSYEKIAADQNLLDLSREENQGELKKLVLKLREQRKTGSLIELMDTIYNYEGFYMEKVNSFQRSNLNTLYQMVLDFQKDNDSLEDLLDYLSAFKVVDREETSSFNSRDNVAQIMTVHQSKGLQFKYVFLADLTFSANAAKYSNLVNLNEKTGIAPKYVSLPYKIQHENPYYDLIKETNQREDFEEEMRILYVALTRAVEGLYVINAAKEEQKEPDLRFDALNNKSIMTWIKTALVNSPKQIRDIVEIRQLSEKQLSEHFCSAEPGNSDKFIKKEFSDQLIAQQTREISPSSLEERDISQLNFHVGTAALRGTLMHKAVELLGIRNVTMEDMDRLPLELRRTDKEKILQFYSDPLTVSLIGNQNEHEYPFIYLQDDSLANGIIDLLSIGEKIHVIDFKSDRNTTEEKLVERYHNQITAYRDIVQKQYPDKEIETLIYSFELQKYVKVY